jgi:hypothetical protein
MHGAINKPNNKGVLKGIRMPKVSAFYGLSKKRHVNDEQVVYCEQNSLWT